MKNPVKAKLKEGKSCIETWATISHPGISEIQAFLGFDCILFNMEYGPLSIETVFK